MPGVDALRELSKFRRQARPCLYRRGDALFELADAMLCTAGSVQSPVGLSLEPEFLRRPSLLYQRSTTVGSRPTGCGRALSQNNDAPAHSGR
jgi:hypothetical protein